MSLSVAVLGGSLFGKSEKGGRGEVLVGYWVPSAGKVRS